MNRKRISSYQNSTYECLERRQMLATFYESGLHVFSMNDILGDFDGNTYLVDSSIIDTSPDANIKTDMDGTVLYPIDSTFGFHVTDFVGALPKVRDGVYAEGWGGDIIGGPIPGLKVSNADTDQFRTPARFGTWLGGIGGDSVKASTEHYVVMQHVLSDQRYPGDPNALYPLDDDLVFVGGPFDGLHVSELNPDTDDLNGDGYVDVRDGLTPNENTITENIAYSDDYSVTMKDDGKVLYRWGNLVKKPNDIRLNFTLSLPQEWYDNPNQVYRVTAAELVVHHTITNNPNDQIRPEDYENEAATGRLPGYQIRSNPEFTKIAFVSTTDAYSGAGEFLPEGTILRDFRYVNPGGLSSDLREGYTNEWYTTVDREPFEIDPVTGTGPRWRLLANKFGQDLPSVDIPISPDTPPPYDSSELKYEAGDEVFTTINLLDWDPNEVSPLLYSTGWMIDGGVSANGLPITQDFDAAIYVKGDKKPVALYDVQLILEYELVAGPDSSAYYNSSTDFAGRSMYLPTDLPVLSNRWYPSTPVPATYDNLGNGWQNDRLLPSLTQLTADRMEFDNRTTSHSLATLVGNDADLQLRSAELDSFFSFSSNVDALAQLDLALSDLLEQAIV